jgi:hypothetical protein
MSVVISNCGKIIWRKKLFKNLHRMIHHWNGMKLYLLNADDCGGKWSPSGSIDWRDNFCVLIHRTTSVKYLEILASSLSRIFDSATNRCPIHPGRFECAKIVLTDSPRPMNDALDVQYSAQSMAFHRLCGKRSIIFVDRRAVQCFVQDAAWQYIWEWDCHCESITKRSGLLRTSFPGLSDFSITYYLLLRS